MREGDGVRGGDGVRRDRERGGRGRCEGKGRVREKRTERLRG